MPESFLPPGPVTEPEISPPSFMTALMAAARPDVTQPSRLPGGVVDVLIDLEQPVAGVAAVRVEDQDVLAGRQPGDAVRPGLAAGGWAKPKPGPFWRTASMQMPFRPWPPGLVTVPAMRPCPAVAAAPALASGAAGRRASEPRRSARPGFDGGVARGPTGRWPAGPIGAARRSCAGRLLRELSAGYMVTSPRDCTRARVEPVTTTDCASPRSKTLPCPTPAGTSAPSPRNWSTRPDNCPAAVR